MRFIQRILVITVVVVFSVSESVAQLASGSVCPDFMATDINGNEFTLYDELNSGKSVLVHVFAAWSPLSWQFHSQGTLQQINELYGPDGTGEISVIMIEGEAANSHEQLTGTGTTGELASAGNWIDGITFPVIDNAEIAALLQTSYFPTVYLICPDRIVFETGAIDTEEILQIIAQNSCDPASATVDAELTAVNITGGGCDSDEYSAEVILRNTGLNTLTEALINAGDLLTFNWTGNLETYEFDTIQIGSINLANGDTVDFSVSVQEDVNGNNDSLQKFVGRHQSSTHVRVQVRTDSWPAETSWKILDESGTVIAQSPGYATMNNQAITHDVYVPSIGCYTFVLNDSGGDGLNGSQWGSVDGYCKVFGVDDSDQLIEMIYFYDASYGLSTDSVSFEVNQVVNIGEIASAGGFVLYPNPVSDQLNISCNMMNAGRLRFDFYNSSGQIIRTETSGIQVSGKYTGNFNTDMMSPGFYLLRISDESGDQSTMPFCIAR